ncbi:MAG: hypothetical protein OQK97_04895 [Deltaproteobacteria bacterium]|jgi:hypothetical protein|nr:hypothetical protein [Deltaproteobacteria bacterium]
MAEFFDRDKSVISRHLNTIFKSDELSREATVAKNATVQTECGREVTRSIEYFNLDVINFCWLPGQIPAQHPFPPLGYQNITRAFGQVVYTEPEAAR